jgi:murein DD-endopeptidase MepM/ murein hydrolase activator NlpD
MNANEERGNLRERFGLALERWFPARQLMLRTDGRISYFHLTKHIQIALVSVLVLIGAWTAFGSVSYVLQDRTITAKEGQIADARQAYRSLLSEVVEYQNKFSSLTQDLQENYSTMLGLVEQNSALEQNLRSVQNRLKMTEEERRQVIAARESLKADLTGIEERMRSMANHNFNLKGSLDTIESDLQVAMSERNEAKYEGMRMRRQLTVLETRLGELQDTEIEVVQRLTEQTVKFTSELDRVIQMTGLKTDSLLPADSALFSGQGGPFVAASGGDLPADVLKASLAVLENRLVRSDALREVMSRLPLSAPLEYYNVTSSFGKRRDPVNKRWAMHYGLDMGAPFRSTIYATAPGVVTYAGWKGRYGKYVEITHGSGVKTRYGHMSKILVKKGQKIAFRDKVGLLGSTGRSTGPHLHYEVVFKGKSKNPLKFIKAGRHVFQEQQ